MKKQNSIFRAATPQRRVRSFVRTAFLASLALVLTAPSGVAALPQDGAPLVQHHKAQASIARARSAADTAPSVTVEAFGRSFELDLVPSDVVGERTRIVTVGRDGLETSRPAPPIFFTGKVRGEADSAVAVTVTDDGTVDGVIRSQGELYYIEPASRYQRGAGPTDLIAYRASEVDASALDIGCGNAAGSTTSSANPPSSSLDFQPLDLDPLGSRAPGGSPGLLQVALIADYEMFTIEGGNTAAFMLGILNQASTIYMNDIDVLLQAIDTVVYETPVDPFSGTSNSSALLGELANHRSIAIGPVHDAGLAHLFTGRDLAGNTVGIAYLDELCDSTFGVGLSERYTPNTYLMTLLLSHEMGHNFGAGHDGDAPCGATPQGFVMWDTISFALDHEFSPCSQGVIAPLVAAAGCVEEAIPENCGDGILDPGEDCDDGNNLEGDCCRLNCTFDSPGAVCPADANACTDDVCDGAGACTHPNNTAACDDGENCTLPGTCGGGVCQPSATPFPLAATRLKGAFKEGDEDKLSVKAKMFGALLQSPPTTGGMTLTLTDSMGAPVYSAVVPAGIITPSNASGTKFQYRAGDIPPPMSMAGITQIKIKYKPNGAQLAVKVKAELIDLSAAEGDATLTLQLEVGNSLVGDCGSATAMPCQVKATSTKCAD